MRRPPAVAGTWYPGDPNRLARAVDGYLSAAGPPARFEPLVGLIAPHAGLMYSGPVAGHAYAALAGRSCDLIVLVGPSHYFAFDGVAVWPSGSFDTPIGSLRVDADAASRLMASMPLARDMPAAHAREHSLEMQLPFLARLHPDVPILPIVMGLQERGTINALADALTEVCAGLAVALVASSDLSHFFDARTAERLDGRVADLVGAFDGEGLLAELERYPEHERGRYVMCGGGPAVSVMLAASRLGARRAQVLCRAHSGDVSGDNDRVVGYLAAAFGSAGAGAEVSA
jgi:hypothetical protein